MIRLLFQSLWIRNVSVTWRWSVHVDDFLSIWFKPVTELKSRIFISATIKDAQNVTEKPMKTILPSWCPENDPKGSSSSRARCTEPEESSHEPLLIQRGYHTLVSQGVIWLASSGLTSREINSEKSAGSQYWASPAAWESSQAKPSFSRWSWKYESPGKNTDSYLWTSFKSMVVLLILGS